MAERLILDTSILVAAERGRLDVAATAGDDADAVVPAVVVAEYLTGVHLAATETQRRERRRFLDLVLHELPVQPYALPVAERHAELLAWARRSGQVRGGHDLMIAATGLATGRTVLTADARARFDDLPGVNARIVDV